MSVHTVISRYVGPAVAAAVLSACSLVAKTPTPRTIPADFQVTIERGPCFGACPVYKLSVLADGAATYDGIQFVDVEGNQTARLTAEEVRAFADAVVEADFFHLADRYEVQITDLPSITVTVTMDGRTKSVYHYGLGCGTDYDKAPASLCALEALLEAVPQAHGWVSSP